jgi:hypothetical protein
MGADSRHLLRDFFESVCGLLVCDAARDVLLLSEGTSVAE